MMMKLNCPRCGHELEEWHEYLRCPKCGWMFDDSKPRSHFGLQKRYG